jgi:hypothetical protein
MQGNYWAYRELCDIMFVRHGDKMAYNSGMIAAWDSNLGLTKDELRTLIRAARRGTRVGEAIDARFAIGLGEFRLGNASEALAELRDLRVRDLEQWRKAIVNSVLAIIYSDGGDLAAAEECLAEARSVEKSDARDPHTWHHYLVAELFLKEAEEKFTSSRSLKR